MDPIDELVQYWRGQGCADERIREGLLAQGHDPAAVSAALGPRTGRQPSAALALAIVALAALAAAAVWWHGASPGLPGGGTPAGPSPSGSPPGDAPGAVPSAEECRRYDILQERTACIRRLANATGDLTLCDAIENQDDRAECRAFAAHDIGGCDAIVLAAKRDRCKANLVLGVRDPAVCRAIAEAGPREQCLYGVAIALGEPALCDEMGEYSYYRSQCIERAGRIPPAATPSASPQPSAQA